MTQHRLKLTIAYRGTRYHGWQRQAGAARDRSGALRAAGDAAVEEVKPAASATQETVGDSAARDALGGDALALDALPTVQQKVVEALQSVVGHPVKLVGSSRTDAGVHAKGQVAHFDTPRTQIPAEGLRRAVNARLPEDILLREVEVVPDSFDAISMTRSKRYQYQVWNAPDRPIFQADLAFHRWQPMDREAMRRAAAHFVGLHDFASFARPGHGRASTVRRVIACDVSWRGPRIVIGVEGTGFLWNMVRIMAGTLIEVGTGRFSPEGIPRMLEARDRRVAGPTSPAHGLFLQWIAFA